MTPAKVDILLVNFCYGGNGGVASTIPELLTWNVKTVLKMKSDPRIGRIHPEILSDTPITMTRNRAVRMAQDGGYDMILMLDSDNEPDGYLGQDHNAKPFWDVAFDFAYERLMKGEPTCIAAPYCGPPPHPVHGPDTMPGGEVPYLFQWMDNESDDPNPSRALEILTRNEAAQLSGIHPVAALPTGVCLFTTSCFAPLKKPYFDYEWNEDHSEKHSTEDVYATRNISLYWQMTKGIDVCFAACDSWALHHKPKKVGKPRVTPVEVMAKSFREALAGNVSAYEARKIVDYTADLSQLPHWGQVLTDDQNQVVFSDEDMAHFAELAAAEEEVNENTKNEPKQEGNIENPEASSNGHKKSPALAHKMVNGRKIALIDLVVTDAELEGISSLAAWAVKRADDGPIRAAVLHSGTGLSTAAIESVLPQGSHLFCLDNLAIQPSGSLKADQFFEAFQPELASGRVKADIEERIIQLPHQVQELDFIFIESGVCPDLLADCLKHVKTGGVIAGLGMAEWLNETVLNVRTHPNTTLWAAAIGDGVPS